MYCVSATVKSRKSKSYIDKRLTMSSTRMERYCVVTKVRMKEKGSNQCNVKSSLVIIHECYNTETFTIGVDPIHHATLIIIKKKKNKRDLNIYRIHKRITGVTEKESVTEEQKGPQYVQNT